MRNDDYIKEKKSKKLDQSEQLAYEAQKQLLWEKIIIEKDLESHWCLDAKKVRMSQ